MVQRIVSFGFKYNEPPTNGPGVVVIDIRQMFRNPHRDPQLRYLNGLDPLVQDDILSAPGFPARYDHLKDMVTAPGIETAYIGCHGGRHRSVYLAQRLGWELSARVEHRDLRR